MKNKVTEQNIRYYDTESAVYDQNRYGDTKGRRVDHFQKNLLRNYFKDLPKGAKVLEFGCGTGRFLPFLSSLGFCMTGVDISHGMLEKANERIKKESTNPIKLIHNDNEILPFSDAEFDAVYSILVINLIKDYEKIFAEIKRVVKPGGLFVFNVPNLSSIFFPAGLYVNTRDKTVKSNESGFRYSHWFSSSEIKSSLESADFELLAVSGQPINVRSKDNVKPLSQPIVKWVFAKSIYIKARRKN